MKNKNGFTLVELLAVIVILAVVMLMAVTAVGPLMAKARKNALADEGIGLANAAQRAYIFEQTSNSLFNASTPVCFDMQWLKDNGYYEKGDSENYFGYVILTPNNGNYTYKVTISNGVYAYNELSIDELKADNAFNYVSATGCKERKYIYFVYYDTSSSSWEVKYPYE